MYRRNTSDLSVEENEKGWSMLGSALFGFPSSKQLTLEVSLCSVVSSLPLTRGDASGGLASTAAWLCKFNSGMWQRRQVVQQLLSLPFYQRILRF